MFACLEIRSHRYDWIMNAELRLQPAFKADDMKTKLFNMHTAIIRTERSISESKNPAYSLPSFLRNRASKH